MSQSFMYETQVPLNGQTNNILLGDQLERAPGLGRYRVFARNDADGGKLVMDVECAGQNKGRSLGMAAAGVGAATPPIDPDNHILSFGVLPGDFIRIILRETLGVNCDPSVRVVFEELTPDQARVLVGL